MHNTCYTERYKSVTQLHNCSREGVSTVLTFPWRAPTAVTRVLMSIVCVAESVADVQSPHAVLLSVSHNIIDSYAKLLLFVAMWFTLCESTLCLKKVPTIKLSVTLSNLDRFSKFLHCWKAYEIYYKTVRHYPPHLRHVATLPWEIKNSNFLQIFSIYGRRCKQTVF